MLSSILAKGSYIGLSLICVCGAIATAPKLTNYATGQIEGVINDLQVVSTNPSEENFLAAQDRVNGMVGNFTFVPEWIQRLQLPEELVVSMTDDEKFLDYLYENALPESVQVYFEDGNTFDTNKLENFETVNFELTEEEEAQGNAFLDKATEVYDKIVGMN